MIGRSQKPFFCQYDFLIARYLSTYFTKILSMYDRCNGVSYDNQEHHPDDPIKEPYKEIKTLLSGNFSGKKELFEMNILVMTVK